VANARISGSIGVVVLMAASDWPSRGELEDKRLILEESKQWQLDLQAEVVRS
jgi:hypothetical protein